MAPHITTIPSEILEIIALETVMLDGPGQPSHLTSLLVTCSNLYNKLSFKNCPTFYARVYKAMFDVGAAHRRFGPRAIRSSNLASQLRANCTMLGRIRQGDIYSPYLLQDFWLAWLLVTESDGKNRIQLEEAGLGSFVDRFVRTRLWEDAQNGWPAEKPINALALWLLWSTTTQASVQRESLDDRAQLVRLLLPYVVMSFKYPSYCAPDNHFFLPLPDHWQRDELISVQTVHGDYPLYRQPEETKSSFTHYGSVIDVCPPSLTAAAKLLYFSRREVLQLDIPPSLPLNRADALARGITRGPTQADLIEVNTHKGAKFLPPSDWDWKSKLTPEELRDETDGVWRYDLRAASALWESDWERMRYCWDPWAQPTLKGSTYTFGCLDGCLMGRMLVPEENGYLNLLSTVHYPQEFSESSPFMSTWPISMHLREHHCINPAVPLPPGGPADDDGDDGITTGWMPTVQCRESGGIVTFQDGEGNVSEYETFVRGRPSSHSADTCSTCINRGNLDEERTRRQYENLTRISNSRIEEVEEENASRHEDYEDIFASLGLPSPPRSGSVDSDDEVDTYTESCSGVRDVIFTGETDPTRGLAWGQFKLVGRVRPWDGLIVLIRIPVGPPQMQTGRARWVFRGYLHFGQALVGSWRGSHTDASSIPWEGAFVVSRRT